MRLSKEKAKFIVDLVRSVRSDAEVYLFGSRTNDASKGGDIDILILSEKKLSFFERGSLESNFWAKFGQQKIDFVSFTYKYNSSFKRLIQPNAVAL